RFPTRISRPEVSDSRCSWNPLRQLIDGLADDHYSRDIQTPRDADECVESIQEDNPSIAVKVALPAGGKIEVDRYDRFCQRSLQQGTPLPASFDARRYEAPKFTIDDVRANGAPCPRQGEERSDDQPKFHRSLS